MFVLVATPPSASRTARRGRRGRRGHRLCLMQEEPRRPRWIVGKDYLPLSPTHGVPPVEVRAEQAIKRRVNKLIDNVRGWFQRQRQRQRGGTSGSSLQAQAAHAMDTVREHVLRWRDSLNSSKADTSQYDSAIARVRAAVESLEKLYAEQANAQQRNVSALLSDLANEAQSRFESLRKDCDRWSQQALEAVQGAIPEDVSQAVGRARESMQRLVRARPGDAELPDTLQSVESSLRDLQERVERANNDVSQRLAPAVDDAKRMLQTARDQYDAFIDAKTSEAMASLGIVEADSIVAPRRGRAERFDLQTALLMAGFTFDAYRDPRPEDGRRFEHDQLATTYLSGDFVRERFAGVLTGRVDTSFDIEYPPEAEAHSGEPVVFYVRDYEHDEAVLTRMATPWYTDKRRVRLRDIPDLTFTPFAKPDGEGGGSGIPPADPSSPSLMDFAYQTTRRWSDAARSAFDQAVAQARADPTATAEAIEKLIRESDVPPGELREWDELQRQVTQEIVSYRDTERLMFVKHLGTDTEFYVWRSPPAVHTRKVIFAFRGTAQMSWRDFLTDAKMYQDDYSEDCGAEGAAIHAGFAEAFRSIRDAVRRVVDYFVESGVPELYFTGHSLGGAMATLAALDTAQRVSPSVRVRMYNFGSPRVGNAVFARTFNQHVPTAYRLVNDADVVARMPRTISMDYHHVGFTVLVNPDGALWVEGQSAGEDPLKERWHPIEALIKAEQRAFESIVNNKALLHHLEDAYFVALAHTLLRS
ncbi:hypothetical protein CDCA_CDCA05G1624 [Cyanidium caldarium]|uniref:Fungal lipase-type domain-containing protein n=1 Tax=Cyanidium caldarium TaxID=2771 RepID=A0AAV9ITM6_CYACA|nr:hypothetical protein CDCA_CDCA05G1624 [Cyanidium caldarium]